MIVDEERRRRRCREGRWRLRSGRFKDFLWLSVVRLSDIKSLKCEQVGLRYAVAVRHLPIPNCQL